MLVVFAFNVFIVIYFFFFSSRRRHTRCSRDWSSDVCSSDLSPRPDPAHHWVGNRLGNLSRARRDPPPGGGLSGPGAAGVVGWRSPVDRKSTRLNSSHGYISYAVFCLKKKKNSNASGTTTSSV